MSTRASSEFEMEEEDGRSSEGSRSYHHLRSLPTFIPQEWSRLLEDSREHHPHHFAIVHTMVGTGLPLVAVLGLQVGDLDLRTKTFQVVRGWALLAGKRHHTFPKPFAYLEQIEPPAHT